MYFTCDDGTQNVFVYQPTLDPLVLKKVKGTDFFLGWKSKGEYTSKRKPLYTTLLNNIKICGYRMEIKFDRDTFSVLKNNYATKLVNQYLT